MHKRAVAQLLGNLDAQHTCYGDDSFFSSTRTELRTAHPPSMCSEPYSALPMAWWKTKNTLVNAASVENFISLKRNRDDFPDCIRVPLTSEDMTLPRDYE